MKVHQRHLLLYFLLTIPLAWLFWIPMILLNRGIWSPPVPVPPIMLSTLGALSPLASLWILQRMSGGEVRLKGILGGIQLRRWRSPWILLSAVFLPALHLLLTLIYRFVGAPATGPVQAFNPEVFARLGWSVLLIIPVHFLAALITSPLFEEPGWRGFALNELRRFLPLTIASLIVGSYWWLWHQGMNLAFDLPPTLPGYIAMLLDSFAVDALYLLSGGNLLGAMLAHQSMGTIFSFLYPLPDAWYLLAVKFVVVAGLRLLLAARLRPL